MVEKVIPEAQEALPTVNWKAYAPKDTTRAIYPIDMVPRGFHYRQIKMCIDYEDIKKVRKRLK